MSPLTELDTERAARQLGWRLVVAAAPAVIVFAFTRQLAVAFLVGVVQFVVQFAIDWVRDRAPDRDTYEHDEARPSVIWFTGLSGSGKSTISEQVMAALEHKGFEVEHLDGDSIRGIFPNTGFSRAERDSHIRRVGYLASRLEQHGVFVVASFVSPYRESRDFVRSLCTNFIEVHVNTPLEVCEARDVKGLYAKARRGEIASFTGIGDPYEAPTEAEVVIDTSKVTVADAVARVLSEVERRTTAARELA